MKLDACLAFFLFIFCKLSYFCRIYTFTKYRQTVEFQLPFRMLQSKNALASSLRLCQIMYVLHTQPKANFFYHLHVAVDNLQFCMSQLTMMYLRNFLVVAQLTILFGIVISAAAPAEARQRRIVNILCDFCGKSFPNSWAYERHRTCTKLKGTGC